MSRDPDFRSAETLDEIFRSGGLLDRKLPGYEFRSSQLIMARAVLEAIQNRHHLCVEAGTGTGKTLAYLVPALFSRKRVIISTATRNLQEQLFFKDIPFIRSHLFPGLRATYMKGRQNFLCLRRLHDQASLLPGLVAEPEQVEALLGWARETKTGDRSELDWLRDDDLLWKSLDARSEICIGQKCERFADCFITRMRQRAFESDIIVVNHALFFANLALERDEIGKVFPDFAVVILDEAHEAEDIAASHFGRQISNYQLEELNRDVVSACGHQADAAALNRLQRRAIELWDCLPAGEGRFSLNFYPTAGGNVRDLRPELQQPLEGLKAALLELYHGLELLSPRPEETDPLIRRIGQLTGSLAAIFEMDDSESVLWFERRGRGTFLHLTPSNIAPILRSFFFERTECAVLASATLTTGGDFGYLKERVGVPAPKELIVPGEFDYANQAILYVPRPFPEPRSDRYLPRALETIRQILEITQGHAFLLFTSFSQMNRIFEAFNMDCPFPLMRQGDMPRNRLLETFRQTPHAVLCATASFWQGVDVQGDALRCVIIDKLPFRVPTEPVVAARIHRLEQQGENSFLRYSVPDAVITLKQGLGRLIRSRKDRGILAVLDSRLWTRQYGRIFLNSLPNCPVTDNMKDLKNFFR